MRKARGMLVLTLALVCATSVGANYEAGQRAWEAGQPDVAVAEWRAGADAGETKSMLALAHDKLQSYQYAFVMPGMVRPSCFDSALPGSAQHERLPVRPERSGAKSKGLSGDRASGFWLSPA